MMRTAEINRYTRLNELAEPNGIVIFGGDADKYIPVGELRQAFEINTKIYNRSFENLSVSDAASVYDNCVSPLMPETVLIHLGDADRLMFAENAAGFDCAYCNLIRHIRTANAKTRIVVVSLRNPEHDAQIEEMNKHLKYINESERCEYGDIAQKKLWNPKATKDAVAFVYSIGFIHPLKNKRPLYDLIRILFCCEA